jgi:hypothetical protein
MARKIDPNSKRQQEIETTKENAEREAKIKKYLAPLKFPARPDVNNILERFYLLAARAATVLRLENNGPSNEGRLILIKILFDILSKDKTLHFFLLDFLARNYGQLFPEIRDLKTPGRFNILKQPFPIPEGYIDENANEPKLPFFVEVRAFCERVTAHDSILHQSLVQFREKYFDRSHWSRDVTLSEIARGLCMSKKALFNCRKKNHLLDGAIRKIGKSWQVNRTVLERTFPGAYDRITS